ncbi:MAG: hypothetical protein PVF83_12450 [Anaerolineales bacterium]|jgi:hypothetical protein
MNDKTVEELNRTNEPLRLQLVNRPGRVVGYCFCGKQLIGLYGTLVIGGESPEKPLMAVVSMCPECVNKGKENYAEFLRQEVREIQIPINRVVEIPIEGWPLIEFYQIYGDRNKAYLIAKQVRGGWYTGKLVTIDKDKSLRTDTGMGTAAWQAELQHDYLGGYGNQEKLGEAISQFESNVGPLFPGNDPVSGISYGGGAAESVQTGEYLSSTTLGAESVGIETPPLGFQGTYPASPSGVMMDGRPTSEAVTPELSEGLAAFKERAHLSIMTPVERAREYYSQVRNPTAAMFMEPAIRLGLARVPGETISDIDFGQYEGAAPLYKLGMVAREMWGVGKSKEKETINAFDPKESLLAQVDQTTRQAEYGQYMEDRYLLEVVKAVEAGEPINEQTIAWMTSDCLIDTLPALAGAGVGGGYGRFYSGAKYNRGWGRRSGNSRYGRYSPVTAATVAPL